MRGLSYYEERIKEVEEKTLVSKKRLEKLEARYKRDSKAIRQQKAKIVTTKQLSTAQLQNKVREKARELIENLTILAFQSKNERIRLEASKVLLNKVVPDLKSMNVTTDERKTLLIKLMGGLKNETVLEGKEEIPAKVEEKKEGGVRKG